MRHLRSCTECQATLQAIVDATSAVSSKPPLPVEDMLARIEDVSQEQRRADVVRSTHRARRWALMRPLWQYGAALAALLAALHLRRRR
jgi:hypothetical protein